MSQPRPRNSASARGRARAFLKPYWITTCQQSWPSDSICNRLSSPIHGVSWLCTVTNRFCWCSTLLCLRLCSSALGTAPVPAVRKTAVPSTRVGGLVRGGGVGEDRRQKIVQIEGVGTQFDVEQPAPFLPGHHQRKHDATDHQREPATLEQLEQVGGKEGQVDHGETAGGRYTQRQRVAPAVTDHKEGQRGGDQHVQRH